MKIGVRGYVASRDADLTVHQADVTVDGLGDPDHFRHARTLGVIGDYPPGPGVAATHPLELLSGVAGAPRYILERFVTAGLKE